ncbi:MAG: ribosome silencing factor [Chloroflexi bacterium]|nr:ribosome silencing factor [Chloroflexota bacterium]
MVAEAVSQKQGSDVLVLDTREYCSFADYFVICTSESGRQTEAIGEEIGKVLKEQGDRIVAWEGGNSSGWLLLDLGDVIVHVFGPAEREFYGLEQLWEKAPVILRIQ